MPKSCTCRESYVKKLSCNMLFGKKNMDKSYAYKKMC